MRKTAYQALVSGRKGQGKSTLADALARGRKRIFVFDVLGEYAAKGFHTVRSVADMIDHVRRNWRRGFKVAYVPTEPIVLRNKQGRPTGQVNSWPEQFSNVARAICSIQQPYYNTPDGQTPPIPKVLFIAEEMAWTYPHNSGFDGFKTICSLGRHYGIDCIGTTQRIAEVSTNFRGNCDVRFFFAQEEHTDIATICKMIGPKNKAALMALRPHEYLRMYQGQVTKGKNPLR